MNAQSTPSAESQITDKGFGLGNALTKPPNMANTTSTGDLGVKGAAMNSQGSSVQFNKIEDEKEREKEAANLFGQALMMAPSFDDD